MKAQVGDRESLTAPMTATRLESASSSPSPIPAASRPIECAGSAKTALADFSWPCGSDRRRHHPEPGEQRLLTSIQAARRPLLPNRKYPHDRQVRPALSQSP